MAKTITQLTETTTTALDDVLHLVDISANQDKKIKASSFWNGKPYGELYVATGGLTTIALQSTWYNLTTGAAFVTTAGLLNNFSHDAATGKLTYDGTEDIVFDIAATLSILGATLGSEVKFAIGVNGSIVTKSIVNGLADANFYYGNYKPSCLQTLSEGDYVQVFVSNETGTDNIFIISCNLQAKAL